MSREENNSALPRMETPSKQAGGQTEPVTCADKQQNHRQRDSSQNKGGVPAPRSAASQSICCFCSTLLRSIPRSAATFSSIPPSFLLSPSACKRYISLIFILNLPHPPTFFAPADYANGDHIQFTINHRSVVRMNMKHNHV